jgi:hypothetical protein
MARSSQSLSESYSKSIDEARPETENSRRGTKATWIKAQRDGIGVRALAQQVGVNASTITRWMRDPEFHDEIKDRQRFIGLARRNGVWPRDERGEALAVDLRANLVNARSHYLAVIKSEQGTLHNSQIKRLKHYVEDIDRYIRWIDEAA